jgi:hypothetical protein
MSYTHKISNSYTTGAGAVGSATASYTGDIEKNVDTNLPASTTDEPIDVKWTAAKVQSLMLTANGAVTVKTNSTSTPGTTINLAANQLLMWGTGSTGASPIPGDVTGGLFVTNAGTAVVAFKVRVLLSV